MIALISEKAGALGATFESHSSREEFFPVAKYLSSNYKKEKKKKRKKEERKKKIILFEIAEKSKEERLKFEIDRAENAATLVLESACSLTR